MNKKYSNLHTTYFLRFSYIVFLVLGYNTVFCDTKTEIGADNPIGSIKEVYDGTLLPIS